MTLLRVLSVSGPTRAIAMIIVAAAMPWASGAESGEPCSERSIVEAVDGSDMDMLARCSGDTFPVDFRSNSGESLLHFATSADPAVVRFLIDSGVDPNLRTTDGETALHYAARSASDPAVLVALLARGADVDALFEKNNRWLRSDRGISALHLAAQRSDAAAIVAALLAGGADPNRRDRDRRTPLHYAAHLSTSLGTVEALLVAGADVNAEDSAGWTPLHLAAASDGASPPIVARLIAFGADTESESDTDQRAIHLAAIHTTSPELLSLLAKAAGTPCPRNGDGANVAEIAAENEHIHGTEIYWQLHEICLDQ